MTRPGVERMPRTAYPSPPVGTFTPLPPHIQGAERRSEGRTRLTALRRGLRVLAVGGLAGAAWLLIGAAAQAADRTDGPDGALLGSIVGADADSPITGLPQVADQPLENPGPAHHERDLAGDILDAVVPVQHGEVSSSPRGRHRYPRPVGPGSRGGWFRGHPAGCDREPHDGSPPAGDRARCRGPATGRRGADRLA